MSRKKSKAPNGAGTVEKRTGKKGKVWYVVRYYVTEVDGSRKQKAKYFNTFDEADSYRVEAKGITGQKPCDQSSMLTVKQWMNIWIDQYLVHLKPRTQESYAAYAKNDIVPALGDILLSELNADSIQRFYNSLIDTRGLSPKTVHNIHGALHVALDKAVKTGRVSQNPSNACELPRKRAREMTVFDDEESKAFLAAVKGHRYEAIYVIDLFTGLRKGEILGLSWDCIDFEKNAIIVNKQLNYVKDKTGHRNFVIDTPKNDKTRVLVVPPFVMKILHDLKARQNTMKIEAGSAWQPFAGYDLVFTNELGRYLHPSPIYKRYKELVRSIGCSDMRLHDLRHSYAVAALKNGDDYKTLQANLGHASSSFTLDTYGHATDEMKRNSASRMEAHIAALIG